MKITIEKKTDQLNYEDMLGGITRIVTIAGVAAGTKEQQYDIAIEGDKRFWRPPPTVLKLLVAAWGDDSTEWVGRRAELYGDPEIVFGRDKVGGIRVSRVSHITKPLEIRLTETRGKRKMHRLDPLPAAPAAPTHDPETTARLAALTKEWHDADPERRKAIEAEANALGGKS